MALGLTPQQIIDKDAHPLLRISETWTRVDLNLVATIQNGYAFPSKEFSKDSGLPLIRIRDILKHETEDFYTGSYPVEFLVDKGDILIGMDGDFNASVWKGPRGLLNQRVCRVLPTSNNYFDSFLIICLQPYLDAINSATSAVTVKHLSSKTIQQIPIPLPPLPEQRAIVSKIEQLFSDLDNGIDNFKKAQEQLKIYRRAVLKKAFEGAFIKGITEFKEVEVNGIKSKIPKSWQLKKLGEYAKLQGGYAFKSKEYSEMGIPLVKISNVHYESIDWTEKSFISSIRLEEFKDYQLFEGDILIAMTRPIIKSLNTVKAVVVKHNDLPALLNQRVGRFLLNNQLDNKYLKYFLYTDFFKQRVLSESSSTQQPNISSKKIENFDFIFPNEANMQHQIVQEIEIRLSICDKMETTIAKSLQKAESLRQSILKKAFEGKLLNEKELKEARNAPDWEPAEKLVERIRQEKQIKENNNKPTRRKTYG